LQAHDFAFVVLGMLTGSAVTVVLEWIAFPLLLPLTHRRRH
jgi:hypothetical protein